MYSTPTGDVSETRCVGCVVLASYSHASYSAGETVIGTLLRVLLWRKSGEVSFYLFCLVQVVSLNNSAHSG